MDYIQIMLSALFSVILLFMLSKLIGERQMSQMSMFDYINGITIGSIAAELAIARGMDMIEPLIAMIVFALATLFLSLLSDKSIVMRRIITGKPIYLMKNGKLFKGNLKKAKMDMVEFLTQCRNQGYFDLSQVDTIVFEPNGTVSILPVSSNRPATPQDLGIEIRQEKISANVIIDGNLMKENLKNIGFDDNWLADRLKERKIKVKEIFLATCSDDGNLTIFPYDEDNGKDIFS